MYVCMYVCIDRKFSAFNCVTKILSQECFDQHVSCQVGLGFGRNSKTFRAVLVVLMGRDSIREIKVMLKENINSFIA